MSAPLPRRQTAPRAAKRPPKESYDEDDDSADNDDDDDDMYGERVVEPVPKRARKKPKPPPPPPGIKTRAGGKPAMTTRQNLLATKQPISKTKKKKKNVDDPQAAYHHLRIAGKPFIISTFEAIMGSSSNEYYVLQLCEAKTRQRTNELWDSLEGTPWQEDHDIACAALNASLSPEKVLDLAQSDVDFSAKALQAIVNLFKKLRTLNVARLKRQTVNTCCMFLWNDLAGTPWQDEVDIACWALSAYIDPTLLQDSKVLSTPGSAIKLLQHCVTKQSAKTVWRLIPKKVQRVPSLSFEAMKLGVLNFHQLHPSVKTKEAVLAGLQQDQLAWMCLPNEMKQDIEVALAIKPNSISRPAFVELWTTVSEDKHRLWTEYALRVPKSMKENDWKYAPDSVKNDSKYMQAMIQENPRFSAFISDELASDFEFIDAVLAKDLQALIDFPPRTFQCFPHILNNSTLKAIQKGLDFRRNCHESIVLSNRLSDDQLSNRNFVLSFVYYALSVPKRYKPSNDKELYKVLVSACRLQKAVSINYYMASNNTGSMDPDLNTYIDLLRYGHSRDVQYCFSDSRSESLSTNYQSWLANYRFGTNYGQSAFTDKARKQLQTFQGFFTLLCGVKSSSNLQLQKLDHMGIKSDIASYLDFPQGIELEDLLAAAPKLSPSFKLFHPYDTPVRDRGAELLATLDLEPTKADYGFQYAVEQANQKESHD